MAHRIDIEVEWDDFVRMKALVDEDEAADFLAVLYAWRNEAVTDALLDTHNRLRAMADDPVLMQQEIYRLTGIREDLIPEVAAGVCTALRAVLDRKET